MQSDIQTTSNNFLAHHYLQNLAIYPIIQSYATISIDINITQSSLYKKYKWITSLKLITSQQYHSSINLNKHLNNQSSLKYLHIDKLLYLLVKFCQEGLPPITRIRTMKYVTDQDWIMLPYPKQSQGLYQLSICYQKKQSQQCKRIITDIQISSEKQLEGVGRGDEWEIAKIPQFSISYYNYSNQNKQSTKQRKTGTGSVGNIKSNDSDDIPLQGKISDRSNRLEKSDLSINSYYSCEEGTSQKQSNQLQQLSDRPPISPGSFGRQSYQDNKKSSQTQFHSMEQQESPLYFIMKTVDLYDNHNEFQYVYQPKKDKVNQLFGKKDTIHFDTLSNFCFPNGIKLSKKIQGFGYQILNFILTSSEGQRLYAYCLKFQEIMDSYSHSKLINQLGDLGFIQNEKDIKKHEKHQLYAQKAFCLISKRSQTDIFHKILIHLYKVFLSFSHVSQIQYFPDSKSQRKNFEFFSQKMVRYIQSLQQNLNNKKINKKVNLQRNHESHHDQHSFKFLWCDLALQIPKHPHHPLSSKSIYCLLKCLTVDNIIKILVCLLTDRKIFFVSNLQNVLGYVIQAFINLIYPLKWNHVIIPIFTYEIIDYLQAPMPIIAGIKDEMVNQQTISLTKGIYVFLDCNKLLMIDSIPQAPNHLKQCQKRLKNFQVYNKMHIEQLVNYQQKAYSFDVHQIQQHSNAKTQQIKQIMFNSMVKLLKNYNLFYKQEQKINEHKRSPFQQNKLYLKEEILKQKTEKLHKTFNQLYNSKDYIEYHSKSSQPFYKQFCKSLSFANLIQNKHYEVEKYLQIKLLDKAIQDLNQDATSKALSCLSITQSRGKESNLRMRKQSVRQSKKHKFLNVTAKKARQSTTERLQRNQNFNNHEFINYDLPVQRGFKNKKTIHQTKQLKPSITSQIHQQRYSQGRNYTNTLQEQVEFQNKEIYFEEQFYTKKQKTVGGNICMIVQNLGKKVSQSGSLVAVWTQAKVNRLKRYFKQEEKGKRVNRKKEDKYINKLNKEMIKQQSEFKITIQQGRTCITQKKVRLNKE